MSIENLFKTVDTRYGRITFFANDIGAVSQSLQTYGEWAENELAFMKALIPQGATVVDVGAYIGTHTLAFAHFTGSDGRVISIEPQDESFALLKRNVATNRLTNVQLEHAAAADHAGTLYTSPIHITEKESFGSATLRRFNVPPLGISAEQNQQQEELILVRLLTIDSLELSSCTLMKIDVEGFEDLVISGAEQTIKRLSPIIYAECNSVTNGMKTLKIMREFGYEVRMHIVDAFNQDNFLGVTKNSFGSAREVALVGVSGMQRTYVDERRARPCELLLKIESADDLVLGMLNKPQYTGEVLQIGTAARSGGDVWIKEIKSFRNDRDEARQIAYQALQEGQQARQEADASRAERDMAMHERDEARQIAHQALQEGQQARQEADASRTERDMAMHERDEARQTAHQALQEGQQARQKADASRTERDMAMHERDEARQEADASRAQMEAAMLQARFAREAADQALQEGQQARQEADASRTERDMAMHERDEARQEADASRAQMEAAMLQARLAHEAADQALQEATQAGAKLADLLQRDEDLRLSLDEVQANLVRAHTDIGQLDQALAAMRASLSWRITQPLRLVRYYGRKMFPVSGHNDAKTKGTE